MRCALCHGTTDYVHGHAACLDNRCPMYGLNQAECCGGETASQCPLSTAEIAADRASVRASLRASLARAGAAS